MIPRVKSTNVSSHSDWELLDDGTLVIHSDIHGVPWASHRTSILRVNIDSGVTTIGNYAFYHCFNLRNISIPNSVTTIGNSAFENCFNLTNVSIPDSVTSIGNAAFSFCSNLRSIYVDSLEQWLSYNHSITGLYLHHRGSLYIGGQVLTNAVIPASVTVIGSYAFSGCDALASIFIPNSITTIGNWTFSGCSSLTSISIPDSVTSIGSHAFSSCSGLTSISIPASVNAIAGAAFSGCSSLTSIFIPASVTSIGELSFASCSSLTNIYVDSLVQWLSYNHSSKTDLYFYGRKGFLYVGGQLLTNAIIPDSVSSIGAHTFDGCSSLESIFLPNSVTVIGDSAFYGCSSLKDVFYSGDCFDWIQIKIYSDNKYLTGATWHYRPYGSCGENLRYTINNMGLLTITGNGAMKEYGKAVHPWDESLLTSVTIAKDVSKLSNYAFYNSKNLSKIYFEGYTCELGTELLSSTPTVYCYQWSDADYWAQDNSLPIVYLDDNNFADYGSIKVYVLADEYTTATSAALPIGAKQQLFASVFPNVNNAILRWTSSNASVATVDENGLVTACGAGDAVITASAEGTTGEISIHAAHYGDMGRVSISDAPASLQCGTSVTLKAVVNPAYDFLTYQWSSSNDKVLSVNGNGVVTAHSKGTATISVNVDGAEASVTITAYETPLTSLSLSEAWGVVSSPIALHWTCEPSNADTLLHWTAEMPSQASAKVSITDDCILTSSALGDVVVTVADEISGITATTAVHVLTPVKAISVPESQTVDACIGQYQLEAVVTTRRNDTLVNKLVTFTTNQPDIAEVDENGLITVKASGTANITVTAESGVSAVFTLNVNHPHSNVTSYPAKAATCQTDGNIAYTLCQSCGRYFVVTTEGLTEIAAGSQFIKGGHHCENGTCKDCGQHFDWSGLNTLTLPAATKEIEPEAFMNVSAQVIIVPTGCTSIGSRAFANCRNLMYVILPSTLESLADDAFAGCGSSVEFIWQ